jgi:hypothetical protein
MKNNIQLIGRGALLKLSLLTVASLGLSGCVYDVGLGYASDGYYDDAYECDPYGGYDSYYQCDYGHGFYNIGYGGGWYDSYWYPGYGFTCSTMLGAVTRCVTITVVIGVKSATIGTAKTGAVVTTVDGIRDVAGVTPVMLHPAQ